MVCHKDELANLTYYDICTYLPAVPSLNYVQHEYPNHLSYQHVLLLRNQLLACQVSGHNNPAAGMGRVISQTKTTAREQAPSKECIIKQQVGS